ncbi:peptide chain release factor 1, mitochondrial-like isoform X2 [Polyodon spathula]|nr:peptide chain release factor 1, mitochondrial-like isoform X2 [Polyodon spathula]
MSRGLIQLSPMATIIQESQRAVKKQQDVQAIIESAEAGEDTQMLELAKEEQKGIRKLTETLQTKLLQSLVPSDKHDASDVIVEVAAGRTTGVIQGGCIMQLPALLVKASTGISDMKEECTGFRGFLR